MHSRTQTSLHCPFMCRVLGMLGGPLIAFAYLMWCSPSPPFCLSCWILIADPLRSDTGWAEHSVPLLPPCICLVAIWLARPALQRWCHNSCSRQSRSELVQQHPGL